MDRIISVALTEGAWKELIGTVEGERDALLSKSEKEFGTYSEVLRDSAQTLSDILYEIKTELKLT